MEIKVKALKFDADEKLVAFVEKKTARLAKFFEGVTQEAEVSLEDIKEGFDFVDKDDAAIKVVFRP